ncbi:MAG: universal stress protein [Saprospirales bacterium]|nr:universal stress protein [Saprospirales bacterium]
MHADLIGISNHERHPLKRILVGSNVEALINHSKLPVLVIDYET